MIQRVLGEPIWADRMQPNDLRALTLLIYDHVNQYGIFELNMDQRIPIETAMAV